MRRRPVDVYPPRHRLSEPRSLQESSGQGHAVDIPVVTCTTKGATRKIRLNRDALDISKRRCVGNGHQDEGARRIIVKTKQVDRVFDVTNGGIMDDHGPSITQVVAARLNDHLQPGDRGVRICGWRWYSLRPIRTVYSQALNTLCPIGQLDLGIVREKGDRDRAGSVRLGRSRDWWLRRGGRSGAGTRLGLND